MFSAETRGTTNAATDHSEQLAHFDTDEALSHVVVNQIDPCTPNADVITAAARDIEDITRRVINGPNRKFAPTYSLPTELLVMILCPTTFPNQPLTEEELEAAEMKTKG